MLDRIPPHDLEAETKVLGSLFLRPDYCDDVQLIVSPEDFYDDGLGTICRCMYDVRNNGGVIDSTVLVDRLKASGDFERVGGSATLMRLVNSAGTSAHAVYYARIVAENAIRRRLIERATDIASAAYEGDDVHTLLGDAEVSILSVRDSRQSSDVREFKDCLTSALAILDEKSAGDSRHLVPTGFPELDKVIGGFRPGRLHILGARTSIGKTALSTSLAHNVAEGADRPVLAVSIEMSGEELANRIISASTAVALSYIDNGTVSESERKKITREAQTLARLKLSIVDSPQITVAAIAGHARRVKRDKGDLGLIAIDYLQLVQPADRRAPRHEQVAAMSWAFKNLARSLDVPVLCLAQLNRQAEQGSERPRMCQIRESGAVEQDADCVMILHRASKDTTDAELLIDKNRSGPTGLVRLHWAAEFARFDSAAANWRDEGEARI